MTEEEPKKSGWSVEAAEVSTEGWETTEIAENEEVKKFLLTTPEQRYKVYKYGTYDLKVVAVMSRKARHLYDALMDPKKMTSLGIAESAVYTLLADLCIQEPWNKRETWLLIDQKQNNAFEILGDINAVVNDVRAAVKNFRKN